jgi:N4-gp56 family major capsid protein
MTLPGTAGDFTSYSGTPGLTDNLVQTAYDLYVRYALNSMPIFRQFVSVRPERQPHPGDAVVLQRFNYTSEANVTAGKTPLTEEADVAPTKLPATTPVTLTPTEYGRVVSHTKKLAGRTLVPFEEYKARYIADEAAKVMDEVIQDKLKAGITETTTTGGAENLLTATDVVEAGDLRAQATKFLENNVPTYDGEFYVAVAHPRVINSLRAAAGSGNWRIAKEYTNDGLLRLAGEMGEFEGFRFVSNNRVRKGVGASSAVTYNTFFFGQGGLAEAVVTEPGAVVGPQVDNLRRFFTLGWYADIDWAVYEPKAIDILISGAA